MGVEKYKFMSDLLTPISGSVLFRSRVVACGNMQQLSSCQTHFLFKLSVTLKNILNYYGNFASLVVIFLYIYCLYRFICSTAVCWLAEFTMSVSVPQRSAIKWLNAFRMSHSKAASLLQGHQNAEHLSHEIRPS